DHSDDLIPLPALRIAKDEARSDRVTIRPESARHLFVDDNHKRRTFRVASGELTPAQNRCPQRLEIIGADVDHPSPESALARRRLTAFDIERLHGTGHTQREMTGHARRLDTGNRVDSLDQAVEKIFSTGFGIAEAQQIERHDHTVSSVKTGI